MEYFIEQALTYTECLNKIRMKYGDRVTILYHKTIRMGGFLGLFTKEGVELTGVATNTPPRNLTALNLPDYPSASKNPDPPKKPVSFEEEKKKVIESAGNAKKDPTLQQVLTEVRTLKEKIDAGVPQQNPDHAHINRINEILTLNDFSPSFRLMITERIKKECSLDMLNDYELVQDKVLEWIGESISIYKEEKFQKKPRILALVGPTGVGKTTTIAKLAAIYGIGNAGRRPINVRMVTIDAFRIGARAQLEAYSTIMSLPVSFVDDYDDLKKTIALYSEETDMLLVDTIGKSPRDSAKLGEMKQLLDACGPAAEVHLTLAATTKSSDIKEIMQQFEPFSYRSVLVTKLDETIRVGNVISALAERRKSVSYITDGQKVPNNIQTASVVRFLINIEGFHVNRAKIESRFHQDESEQIQWR
ncbi:flagellar biosynthesis protein FlhF [Spirochaetia bacterium]|nr:flagellar biosynthesis protein FlhF [Spirochaetia bacterium]GHU29266.1 flagellar biosynthesis protein FlhF [Spirochaetia bacterium]